MQLLTFGSRELKPNDQLHVNWKLAQARAAALALFCFSQVLSPTPKKKFNFKKQGGVFLWLTNIDLGHQRYFFPFYTQSECRSHYLATTVACVGLHKRWKSDFQVPPALRTRVEIQSIPNATHQKVSIDCLNTQESDILTKGQINEAKG